MKTFLNKNYELATLLQRHASQVINFNGDKFSYLPFIFKEHTAMNDLEIINLSSVPDEYKDAVMQLRGVIDAPITEQFLLSKGWKKGHEIADASFEIYPSRHTMTFNKDHKSSPEVIIWNEYGFHDGLVYSGAIPTESQYEVLNQLLKLHP